MDGSNDGQHITHPPLNMGLNTCRTIPPTWNRGIKLQFTSDGLRSQLSAIVAAAVSISPMLCGTNFLFPVVPDVNNTNTSSLALFGSVDITPVYLPSFLRDSGNLGASYVKEAPRRSIDGDFKLTLSNCNGWGSRVDWRLKSPPLPDSGLIRRMVCPPWRHGRPIAIRR